ncbi:MULTISPECIES: signal peptide peptidase SppA [unclassified Sphingomonas]|uniref:signal peptide peptidase SppA n=1 Tax=unclassified Sphingomonas TaxID=196159 RepID=UPI0006FA1EFD|nr:MULTISPECIES: signal peptide peptidase SppA [unclassified Sphingomonas]KQX18344.1 signal peptide peptidase SppA [Sphingomonas sp. Root1294]KQY72329.1 signal peptide peptidase SppA [Sphingomonas sp. Root50]KRB94398.1 signal peptide peptidase SppA [Sphingomonas sp. Root720]
MTLVRGLWKLLVGIKDGLVLIAMLIFFGTLFLALSIKPNPTLPSSGALVVDLTGTLVEQPAETDPLTLLAGNSGMARETRLRDLERSLQSAAASNGVKAIVLDLDAFAGGEQATIAAAGHALDKARAAGKPIFAYATGYSDDGYQLAAHATEIWLNPLGGVILAGPGGSRLYFKGLMDRLGITAKIYRVGAFKSAVEPYMRSDQSPEAREANQALANALWSTWMGDVGKARPRAKLAAYVEQPVAMIAAANGKMSQAAIDAGLVDRLGDRNAFNSRVAAIAGAAGGSSLNGFKAIPLDRWANANPEKASGTPIGVLTVAGDIIDGEAPPGAAGGTTISNLLLDELGRKRIKALVVRIDSPGGSVTGAETIRSAILEAKGLGMPVVVSMGGLAASGGYWISTPADRIIADPATITGSIGVFGILPTFEGSLAKLGLSADGVKTTPLSGEPDVFRGTSPQFDAMMQGSIEDIYRRFTGLVAQSRKLPIARVREIAEGRVWAGSSARQIGLVDGFGSVDDAVAEAARLAKLDPAKVRPLYIEKPLSPWKEMIRTLLDPDQGNGEASGRAFWGSLAGGPDRVLIAALANAQRVLTGPAIQVRCLECVSSATQPRPDDIRAARSLLAWATR